MDSPDTNPSSETEETSNGLLADNTFVLDKSFNTPSFSSTLNSINKHLIKADERIAENEYLDSIKREWQQVALVIDRLLLVIFLLLTTGTTLGMLLRGKQF